MSKLILLKIFKNLSAMFARLATELYLKKDCRLLFPANFGKQGIYLRQFQSKTRKINGMISALEAEALLYLSSFQDLKGDILELGSWVGKSTIHLAKGCQVSNNGKVHAIDTFKGTIGKEKMFTGILEKKETIYKRFQKNIRLAGVKKYVKAYQTTSVLAGKKINQKFRLIFIDGSHDYDSVNQDIEIWSKKLKKGGLLVFDDFTPRFPGVLKAVTQNIIKSKNFKVLLVIDSLLVAKKE